MDPTYMSASDLWTWKCDHKEFNPRIGYTKGDEVRVFNTLYKCIKTHEANPTLPTGDRENWKSIMHVMDVRALEAQQRAEERERERPLREWGWVA